jgi:hypothetical protein
MIKKEHVPEECTYLEQCNVISVSKSKQKRFEW